MTINKLALPIFAVVLAAGSVLTASSETVFFHVEDEMSIHSRDILEPVREGMLDGFFENGHIAFDSGPQEESNNVTMLVRSARQGGAKYLVYVTLSGGVDDRIDLSATFSVFESTYGSELFEGIVQTKNIVKNEQIKDNLLVFEFGQEISFHVHQYFASSQNNSNF